MKTLIINDKKIGFEEGRTILQVATANGIHIPSLCCLEDCKNGGQCGICVVEIEGQDRLARSCCIKAKEGMVIKTDSERVQNEVKFLMTKLLDNHEFKCGQCRRKEDCEFLKLVIKTKARASKPFIVKDKSEYVDSRSKSIVLDKSKCVNCGRCVAACRTKSGTKVMKFHKEDGRRIVGPDELKCFDDTNCILCGQCIIACPVDALSEKPHIDRVKEALADENKHVIVAIAPSVRTALGERLKMGYGVDVTGKTYAVLRKLGFDKVFDINFGADMTIMEEATELVERIKKGGPFPMFTSCCSGWVRQARNYFPEFLENLSSAKSPQQEFGAASKSYYATISGINPENIFTVTVMPCVAKKYEADMPEMQNDGFRNIDAVITTRELALMIKNNKIDFANLEDEEADPAMGEYTGAGTIFGATGGVMEAALRTAVEVITGEELIDLDFKDVRGVEGIKEASYNVEPIGEVRVAVASGLANARKLLDMVKSGEKSYHFIEIMACPGGCVNGGGQPHVPAKVRNNIDVRSERAKGLYTLDKNKAIRKSHENPMIVKLYEEYLGEPNGEKAHHLLHTSYVERLINKDHE